MKTDPNLSGGGFSFLGAFGTYGA